MSSVAVRPGAAGRAPQPHAAALWAVVERILARQRVVKRSAAGLDAAEIYRGTGLLPRDIALSGVASTVDPKSTGRITSLPHWSYSEPDDAVTVGELAPVLKTLLDGSALKLGDMSELTRLGPSAKLRVASQLSYAARQSVEMAAFRHDGPGGGLDVYARVASQSGGGKYRVYMGVRTGGILFVSCSCPLAAKKKGLLCKHAVAVLANAAPLILAHADSSLGGGDAEELVERWRENGRRAAEKARRLIEAGKAGVEENVAYYLAKFALKKLSVFSADVPPDTVDLVLDSPGEAVLRGVLKAPSMGIAGEAEEVEYPEWAVEARERLRAAAQDLAGRMGLSRLGAEWPRALVYGLVASSDPLAPPVVVHAVGNIGTYKTFGAKMAAEYAYTEHLVVEAEGVDGAAAYDALLALLEKWLGVPRDVFASYIGGLVADADVRPGRLEVRLSLPHVAGILARYADADGVEAARARLEGLLRDLEAAGFTLRPAKAGYGVRVLDPVVAGNVEDYLQDVVRNARGWMRRERAFGSHVVVLDEFSRALAAGGESLLTRTSIGGVDTTARLLVATDNIEPFLEVARDRRLDPFHDRVVRVFTPEMRNPLEAAARIAARPSVRLGQLELMAVRRLVSSIPVPDAEVFRVQVAFNLLAYTYEGRVVDGEAVVAPARRAGDEWRFVPGGRFVSHSIMMARYNAFMRGAGRVGREDTLRAIAAAAASRVLFPRADGYEDYKRRVAGLVEWLTSSVGDDTVAVGVRTLAGIDAGEWAAVEEGIDAAVDAAARGAGGVPAAVVTAFETALAVRGAGFDAAPGRVRLQAAAVALLKGDLELVSRFRDEIKKLGGGP